MEEKLQSIIKECRERGIPISVTKGSKGQTAYEVKGFSKSGIALIYIKEDKVVSETRYNTIDEIDNFHDLSMVAFEWFISYKDRTPFENPDPLWAEYWAEKGIVQKRIVTKTEYIIK